MRLRDLHTPAPLTESDYTAVRAHVLGEMTARSRRWRYALAIAAMLAIAVLLRRFTAPTPAVQQTKPPIEVCASCGAANPGVAPVPVARESAGTIAGATTKRVSSKPKGERIRIELHTSDPDIRIIWIVTPKLKEES